MGFKAFLKGVGTAARWAGVFVGMIPVQSKALGYAGDILGKIAIATATAELTGEALGAAKGGAAKMTAVAAQTAQWIKTSELVAGREIADEDMFEEGAKKIAEGVLLCQKALKG